MKRHPFEPDLDGICKRCNLPRTHKVHTSPSVQPMLLDEDTLRRIVREEIQAWADAQPIQGAP